MREIKKWCFGALYSPPHRKENESERKKNKTIKGNPPKELQELLAYMEKTSRENAVNTVLQEIADELEEDLALVEKICDAAKAFAPEYDEEKIYEVLTADS